MKTHETPIESLLSWLNARNNEFENQKKKRHLDLASQVDISVHPELSTPEVLGLGLGNPSSQKMGWY